MFGKLKTLLGSQGFSFPTRLHSEVVGPRSPFFYLAGVNGFGFCFALSGQEPFYDIWVRGKACFWSKRDKATKRLARLTGLMLVSALISTGTRYATADGVCTGKIRHSWDCDQSAVALLQDSTFLFVCFFLSPQKRYFCGGVYCGSCSSAGTVIGLCWWAVNSGWFILWVLWILWPQEGSWNWLSVVFSLWIASWEILPRSVLTWLVEVQQFFSP